MTTDEILRNEDIRYDVRHHLATRSTLARDLATIHRSLSRDNDYSMAEILRALGFLTDLGHVKAIASALGATVRYQITAAGQLADERGE